jgi:predicted NUDIX family phosphoesterase
MSSHPEKILCIKESLLFEGGKWNGIRRDNLDSLRKTILDHMEFRARDILEEDPNYKQVIAQVVLKYKDRYFLHRQCKRSEGRLNSLCPLPVGGHIEEFDLVDGKDVIMEALVREMNEEVNTSANIVGDEFLGVIYIEDGNPVNYVHIGFVYVFELDSDDVHVREEGLENIGFVDMEYLKKHRDELTYWSREIISYL